MNENEVKKSPNNKGETRNPSRYDPDGPILILGRLAVENEEIQNNPQLHEALSRDKLDCVISVKDFNKPKLCIKNPKNSKSKKNKDSWVAVAFIPSPMPQRHDSFSHAWTEYASCRGIEEDFFPEKGASNRRIYEICEDCLVRAECLEFALFNEMESGIWGGFSNHHHRGIKKARRTIYEDNLTEDQINLPLEKLNLPSGALQIMARAE